MKHKVWDPAQTFTKCKLVEHLLPKVGRKILYIVIIYYIEYNGLFKASLLMMIVITLICLITF